MTLKQRGTLTSMVFGKQDAYDFYENGEVVLLLNAESLSPEHNRQWENRLYRVEKHGNQNGYIKKLDLKDFITGKQCPLGQLTAQQIRLATEEERDAVRAEPPADHYRTLNHVVIKHDEKELVCQVVAVDSKTGAVKLKNWENWETMPTPLTEVSQILRLATKNEVDTANHVRNAGRVYSPGVSPQS